MGKTVNIGGRIHNPEVGNVVAGANEILDDTKGKKQNMINSEVDTALAGLDSGKQDKLSFDQAPTESSTNPVTSGGVYAADQVLQQAIEAILLLIPSAASALNQLADKSFVNSSIATASATFRGTYNLVSDLHLSVSASHQDIATALASVVATADNNDYCFVQIPTSDTSSDIRVTERYKFNGTAWAYEYDLNNSGFTAQQWAAINSTITSALVGKLSALPTADELAALLAGKQATLTFDSTPTPGSANPVTSGGLYDKFEAIIAKIPSDASANNKLVAENRLAAYIGGIIGALDATFDLTSTDGHVTLRITQTDGLIASVQVLTSDIASAAQVSQNTSDIATLQDLYNALQQSAPEIIQPTDTWPVANPSDTVIYRVIDRVNTPPEYYSDYMWNGTTMVLMAIYNNAIDPRPKKGSANLVTSGGVFDNIGALDISELNATGGTLATYATLDAALAAIPSDYQKGGMSIKFVQISDNKYVQYRLMSDTFNTTPANWQGVDDKPTAGSDNLVKSGRVAEEFDKVNEDIVDIKGGSFEKYVPLEMGYCITTNSAPDTDTSANYGLSDYIPVNEGDVVSVYAYGGATILILTGYTSQSQSSYVSDFSVTGNGAKMYTKTIPSGINYIRVVCSKSYADNNAVTVTIERKGEIKGSINGLQAIVNPMKNQFLGSTNHPAVSPRKACVVMNLDLDIAAFGTLDSYVEVLKSKGIDTSTFLMEPTNFATYAKEVKELHDAGNEIALHGEHRDSDLSEYIDSYMEAFSNGGISANGFVELATEITDESLELAKKYFSWVVKRYGDYNYSTYEDSINIYGTDDQYHIKRLGLDIRPENYDSTYQQVIENAKAAIDLAITNGGLLILFGHSYNNTSASYTVYPTVLAEILTYLKEKMDKGLCVTGNMADIVNYYYAKRDKEIQKQFESFDTLKGLFAEIEYGSDYVITGSYIKNNGTVDTSVSDMMTHPIPVAQGDLLKFRCAGNGNAQISKTDSEGTSYEVLIQGVASEHDVSWISPFDGYVAISSTIAGYKGTKKVSGEYVNDIIENYDNANKEKCGVFAFDDKSIKALDATVLRESVNPNCSALTFKKDVHDKFYAHLRVKFPENVHDVTSTLKLFSIDGHPVYLLKRPTSSISSGVLYPVPLYAARIQSHTAVDDYKWSVKPDGWNMNLLLGPDAFSIRFAGDCDVVSNQDIKLKIDDTVVRIYHGTNDTTIASYTKASYNTIKELYQAMLADTASGGSLEEFELEWFNVDEITPDDLIMCDVNLVAQYPRYNEGDIDRNPTGSAWDGFPFYFTTKEKGKIYDIEIVYDSTDEYLKGQLIVDGYGVKIYNLDSFVGSLFNKTCDIIIGDKSENSDIEILSFEINDELNYKYPNLRIYYSENTVDGMNTGSTYSTSREKVAELATILERDGFGTIELRDIEKYLDGSLKLKGGIAHFSHDDGTPAYFNDEDVLNCFINRKLFPSYGMRMESDIAYSDAAKSKIRALFNAGFDFMIHSFDAPADSPVAGSLGCQSYVDMVSIVNNAKQMFMDRIGVYPTVWDFHQTLETYNQIRYLMNHGFTMIFGGSLNGLVTNITRYRCKRVAWRDATDPTQVKKHLNNYLNWNV